MGYLTPWYDQLTKDRRLNLDNVEEGRIIKSFDGNLHSSAMYEEELGMIVSDKSVELPPSSLFGGNQIISFAYGALNHINYKTGRFGNIVTQDQGSDTSFDNIKQFKTSQTREVVLQPYKDQQSGVGTLVFAFYQTPNPAVPTALGTIDEFYTAESSVTVNDMSFDLYAANPLDPPLFTEEDIKSTYGSPMISEKNLTLIADTETKIPLVNRPRFETLQFFYAVAKGSANWKGRILPIPVGGGNTNYFIPFLKGTGVDVLSEHDILDRSFCAHGSMYENNESGTTILSNTTYTGWESASQGVLDPNGTVSFENNISGDRLVVGEGGGGHYRVHFNTSASSSVGAEIFSAIHVNGVEAISAKAKSEGLPADPVNLNGSDILILSELDYIDLRVKLSTAGNVVVFFTNVNIQRVSYN